MRFIIAGGRDFKDIELMSDRLNQYVYDDYDEDEIEIVSGGQCSVDKDTGEKYGADYLGEQWAKSKGYGIKLFPADWKNYGKSAGPIRNKQMADYSDALIAFWDGKSKGTKNMIELAREDGMPIVIVRY